MVEFLEWLKENSWHAYKDGSWYSLNEKEYIHNKPRKYYNEEEVVEAFIESKKLDMLIDEYYATQYGDGNLITP